MKKLTLIAMAVLMFVTIVSCKNIDEESGMQSHGFYDFHGCNVTVEDSSSFVKTSGCSWLHFESRADYERAVGILSSSKGDDILTEFERTISFGSMRSLMTEEQREEMGVEDDVLATLLNTEGIVQIDGFVFQIDMCGESAMVYDLKHDGAALRFSTKDSFWEYLDGKTDESKTTNSCAAKNKDSEEDWYGETINFKVVYQHALIYFSLQSKITKQNSWGGTVGIYVDCPAFDNTTGYSCYRVNGDAMWQTVPGYSEGGNGHSYNYRPYSSTKRLTGFRFLVDFGMSHEGDYGTTYDWKTLAIDCGSF